MKFKWHSLLFVILAIATLLALSLDANAQCAMCRAVVSGSNNAKFARNLNIGVLVLLLPPVTIFCSIFVILRRHRGETAEDSDTPNNIRLTQAEKHGAHSQ